MLTLGVSVLKREYSDNRHGSKEHQKGVKMVI